MCSMTEYPPDSLRFGPEEASPEAVTPHDDASGQTSEVNGEPFKSISVPPSKLVVAYRRLAFALSALLSPYLVIPIATVGIVATQKLPTDQFIRFTEWSIFFSTFIPSLYVVVQILRGKITDVHVMEREQRGGPLLVAAVSSGMGACVLRAIGAPRPVWGIGVVLAVNGFVFLGISTRWKISIHVAVLSSAVLASLIMIPNMQEMGAWRFELMIPVLIWARTARKRHTAWQGIAACAVACCITWLVLSLVYQLPPGSLGSSIFHRA